jgi:hypothetical protein
MKYLKKSDLNKVHPKFRQTAQTDLENGEDVPYGVVYLTDRKPSKKEIEHVKKLIEEGFIKP